MRRRAWCSLAAALAVAVPAAAFGSPLQLFGLGGRSPALAATGVAAGDDFDCVYLNPAGLADLRRRRFTLGTLVGAFDLRGVDRPVDDPVGVEVGAALPLPLGGVLRDRVGLGIGIYVPTDVAARARTPRPGRPYFALLESRSESVGLQAAVGVRLDPRWSVGAGFLALAALAGRIDVTMDAAGRLTTISEQQLVTHFAPILGARWRTAETLVVGATLRGVSRSAYDIVVTSDLGGAVPVTLPPLRFAGVAQYDPLTLAVEGAWRARGDLLVTGQLAWERWSAFPRPTENPVEGGPPPPAPGFHDTVVPRAGVEWAARVAGARLALRGGYAFVPSPAPPQTGPQALIDNHRHVLSAGLGLATPGRLVPVHLDLWFQAHLLVDRRHDRPEGEPDVTSDGELLVGGLTLGVDL